MPDGPRSVKAQEITRPNYGKDTKKTSMDKPPPPGTTSVEKFIENMTVSLGF